MDEAELAKELRRLRRERKRLLQKEDEPSEADLDTALLVVWHSMGDLRLGQQYLRECRARQKRRRSSAEGHVSLSPQASAKRPPAPEECPQSWYRALENRWMAWSMDDEVAALVTVGPRETRSSRAKSFVDGAHLETYLQRQNQKGIAPRGPALLRARNAAVEPLADAARGEAASDRRKQRRRQNDWLRRWAKRRGVLRGRFKAGPGLSLEEVRAKASSVIEKAAEAVQFPLPDRSFFRNRLAKKKRTRGAGPRPRFCARRAVTKTGPRSKVLTRTGSVFRARN